MPFGNSIPDRIRLRACVGPEGNSSLRWPAKRVDLPGAPLVFRILRFTIPSIIRLPSFPVRRSRKRPYDYRSAARRQISDSGLTDALTEFLRNQFSFRLWRRYLIYEASDARGKLR